MNALKIREASNTDIPILIDFQTSMAMETEKVLLNHDVLAKGMNELFRDAGKGKYYVAEVDGVVAGCLMTTFEWSEWRNGTVLWIQSVYIAHQYRGKGIYKAMYEHIQDLVTHDSTLRGIRLYADRTNKDARNVYAKLGMDGEHYQVFEWMKS